MPEPHRPQISNELSDLAIIGELLHLVSRTASQALIHPSQTASLTRDLIERISSLLGMYKGTDKDQSLVHNSLVRDVPSLFDSQYVLPVELEEINISLLGQLGGMRGNDNYTHSGLMLCGVKGTGKSEYIRYLKGKLGERLITYYVDTDKIIASPAPAETLRKLYDELQSKAVQEGKYVVILLDEVDIFMREYASIRNDTTRSSQSGSDRHIEQVRSISEAQIDPIGAQLFSTLKTIMSGSGAYNRIFTIATTNQNAIPGALGRDARFQVVEIKRPFLDMRSLQKDTDYKILGKHLVFAIKILAATYCRLEGLGTTPEEFEALIKEAQSLQVKLDKIIPKQSGFIPTLKGEQICKIRTLIFDFLEIPEGSTLRSHFIGNTRGYEFKEREVLSKISGLTQSALAASNKRNANKPQLPTKDPILIKAILYKLFFSELDFYRV